METFSALLAICAGNSPVTGEFPTQRPVTRSFDVYFDLRPNERLSKQSWGWWFETLSSPLWRHRNANIWRQVKPFIILYICVTARGGTGFGDGDYVITPDNPKKTYRALHVWYVCCGDKWVRKPSACVISNKCIMVKQKNYIFSINVVFTNRKFRTFRVELNNLLNIISVSTPFQCF